MNKILITDDDRNLRRILSEILEVKGFEALEAAGGREALDLFTKSRPDAVILDLKMPGMNGIETLQEFKKLDPDVPVIIITAYGDVPSAVEAIKLGAYDFLIKPPNFDSLIITLKRAIEKYDLDNKVKRLNSGMDASLEWLLGKSEKIKAIISQVIQVAWSNYTVVLQGDTGTGKTYIAGIIHNLSDRAKGPFIAIDIGAIPENLVESELFGYEKGAFTGAEKRKKGFFEVADHGTILLDELQNMSPYVQSRLLKAVEEKKICPLGSTDMQSIDVRIISTVNINLQKAVEEKKFREDLFYRLSEVVISIPPLRERRDDIPFFTEKFFRETCEELNKKMTGISDEAKNILYHYHWPGNIRELKNVVRRAVLFSQNLVLGTEEINFMLDHETGKKDVPHIAQFDSLPLMTLDDAEKFMIRKALELEAGNKTKAAAKLKIDYKTLLRKIKHYGI